MPSRRISNREELARAVTALGLRLQRVTNRTARSKARITKYTKLLAEERARLVLLNAKDAELSLTSATRIWLFSEENLDLRQGQQVELGSGIGAYRSAREGALSFEVDEQTSIEEIRSRFPEVFDAVVQTKESILKNVLKRQYSHVLDQMTTASAPGVQTFAIQAAVTDEVYRQPTARLHQTAVALGLLPDSEPEERTGPLTSAN